MPRELFTVAGRLMSASSAAKSAESAEKAEKAENGDNNPRASRQSCGRQPGREASRLRASFVSVLSVVYGVAGLRRTPGKANGEPPRSAPEADTVEKINAGVVRAIELAKATMSDEDDCELGTREGLVGAQERCLLEG